MPNQERDARKAYDDLMEAFRSGRVDDYFEAFHPDASFMFHGQTRLSSRAAYRETWESWERESGFQVLGCTASDVLLQIVGHVAVVSHAVETRVRADGEETTMRERETIVFHKQDDGRWLAIHEHLSEDGIPLEAPSA